MSLSGSSEFQRHLEEVFMCTQRGPLLLLGLSLYCSFNQQCVNVLLCSTNKLQGNSDHVSCALEHLG